MREILLSKEGSLKLLRGSSSLYYSDIETSIKSCTPGEWVVLVNAKTKKKYYGFANPLVDNRSACIQKVGVEYDPNLTKSEILLKCLDQAQNKRSLFKDYSNNNRLFFGTSDGLPGLIIDTYENCTIVQINSAGIDHLRDKIKNYLTNLFSKTVLFLDNQNYRKAEGLPVFEQEKTTLSHIHIKEGDLSYTVSMDELQKVGFYFDHRENRIKLKNTISRLNKKPSKGVDLFSYIGAWGMTMLKAGVEEVSFVDQGNFENILKANLADNSLPKSEFIREDVFKYLKDCQSASVSFDIICSDPPAFCKSAKEKRKAIEGYTKLHTECMKVLSDQSLFIAASCTHYVSLEELVETVNKAAIKTQKKITLIDIGGQGIDHPTQTLTSTSNYLKYSLFYVENL